MLLKPYGPFTCGVAKEMISADFPCFIWILSAETFNDTCMKLLFLTIVLLTFSSCTYQPYAADKPYMQGISPQ